MRGTGPLERKSSIIQREVKKERVEEKEATEWEPLADRRLEYTAFRGLEGECVIVDRQQVRNYQSTPVPLLLQVDVRCARKDLAGVPVFVVQSQNSWRSRSVTKSVALCSQVSSLCRTSLWNNSFTLAAAQYGHNHSCHQPAVQAQAEELYSYENHGDPFRAPKLYAQLHPVQQAMCHLSQTAQCSDSEENLQEM